MILKNIEKTIFDSIYRKLVKARGGQIEGDLCLGVDLSARSAVNLIIHNEHRFHAVGVLHSNELPPVKFKIIAT